MPDTKILLIGDLHYGFDGDTRQILETFFQEIPKDVDILLIAGDTISCNQHQWDEILALIRKTFPTMPILTVMGNHDYWTDGVHSFNTEAARRNQLFEKYNIHRLEYTPFIFNDIAFFGFDGWYGTSEPPSNDFNFIPRLIDNMPFNDYLFHKSVKQLEAVLEDLPKYKNSVVLSHFEPNDHSMGSPSEWLDKIKERKQDKLIFC